MAHRIVFYPVGNGDTSQIILSNGKRILMDFRHLKCTEDGDRAEINLAAQLKQELKDEDRDYFDVVAFTHADKDHIENSTEFFHLEHSSTYQGPGRIKIETLWVPAAMILEECSNDQRSSEFVIWRQEARHRLKTGSGIRVFSKPEKLKDWLADNGIKLEDRRHLITDAGQIAADFSLDRDGVEFFCHSPFIKHVDDGDDLRNSASLVFNIRFKESGRQFDYLAIGDSKWDVLEDIVKATRAHDNQDRLEWDLFNIPHHCSAYALAEDKGEKETTPTELVRDILMGGKQNSYLISSSAPILDNNASYEESQPPHIQAKNCYETYRRKTGGAKFLVTMEYPNTKKPKPMEFTVSWTGLSLVTQTVSAVTAIAAAPAPRAGSCGEDAEAGASEI